MLEVLVSPDGSQYAAPVSEEGMFGVFTSRGNFVGKRKRVELADWTAARDPLWTAVLTAAAKLEKLRRLHRAVPDHGRFSGECVCNEYCEHPPGEPEVCAVCRDYAGNPLEMPCPDRKVIDG